MEQAAFSCLAISTLCEPIFFSECRKFWRRRSGKNRPGTKQQPLLGGVSSPNDPDKNKLSRKKKHVGFAMLESSKGTTTSQDFGGSEPDGMMSLPSQSMISDDDDFEEGRNQILKKDEIDVEDEDGFQKIVREDMAGGDDDEEIRDTMTVQQKTNFFVSQYS